MKLGYETDFAAWESILESELILFLAKHYKAENDTEGEQKEQLKMAILKTNVDGQLLKHSHRIKDGRATYSTLLAEIKEIWAKGETRSITSEDLPEIRSRDDWATFKDKAARLAVIGYTESTLIELLRVKLSDLAMKNLFQSKGFNRMSDVATFMDKMEWPDQTAAMREREAKKETDKTGNFRRNIRCYHCGKGGHVARFCWHKSDSSKNGKFPSPEH